MSKTGLRFYLTTFVLTFYNLSASAQTNGASKIDTSDLRRHLEIIASDSLSGRWVETPDCGICKAAGYLKSTVAQMGLKEGFPGYLQSVPLVSSAPDTINSFIEIRNKKKKLLDKTVNVPSVFTGNSFKTENARLVFAGFGLKDENSGYNDFSGIDISGKVVVFSTGTPASFGSNEKLRWNNQLEMAKTAGAIKAGAAAVVMVISPTDNAIEIYNRLKNYLTRENWSLANTAQNAGNNFIITTESWADKVLGKNGPIEMEDTMLNKDSTILITKAGEIKIGDKTIDTLLIMNVGNSGQLSRSGDSNFSTVDQEYFAAPESEYGISQGYLEGANTNIIEEMEAMIQLNKEYESAQKIIAALDHSLGQANEIGKV